MPKMPNTTALLIEDDMNVRAALAIILASWGGSVLEAASVDQAEAAVRRDAGAPHLIITDLHLINSHCQKTVAAILGMTERIGFRGPIVAMSGDTSADCRKHVEAMGWPLLIKPFTPTILRQTLAGAVPAIGTDDNGLRVLFPSDLAPSC